MPKSGMASKTSCNIWNAEFHSALTKRPALRGSFAFLQAKKGAVLPAHSFVPTPFISKLIILMKSHPAIVLAAILCNLCLSLDTGLILAIS